MPMRLSLCLSFSFMLMLAAWATAIAAPAKALSIGVSPAYLSFSSNAPRELLVINPNRAHVSFTAASSDGYFRVSPAEGRIEAGSHASILIEPVDYPAQNSSIKDSISIIFNSSTGERSILPGITVPAEIPVPVHAHGKESSIAAHQEYPYTVFRVRKLVDYAGIRGKATDVFRMIRKAEKPKKGIIIIMIEVGFGLCCFYCVKKLSEKSRLP